MILYKNPIRWYLHLIKKSVRAFSLSHTKCHVENSGRGKIIRRIKGKDNTIKIGERSYLDCLLIHIVGNNNIIEIDEDCNIGKGCSFWIEGNGCHIKIGSYTTMTQYVHLNAQEDNMAIRIGNDCMLSNHIIIRTSDAHPVIDLETNERINPAKSVLIGNHVWIAPNTTIMKGSIIEKGSIIGSHTVVTKSIPMNSLAVGMPAKVLKTNITWTRERVIP